MIRYTRAEIKYIIDHRHDQTAKEIAIFISAEYGKNRSPQSVALKLWRMGMSVPHFLGYSAGEVALIGSFIGNRDLDKLIAELKKRFGTERTKAAVQAKKVKIKKDMAAAAKKTDKPTGIMPDFPSMDKMKIAVKRGDLIRAMSHTCCNSYVLAIEIVKLTGFAVTTDQVTHMQTATGMPRKYATPEVREYLGL